MSRKRRNRQRGPADQTPAPQFADRTAAQPTSRDFGDGGIQAFVGLLVHENRPGLIGFLLSVVQLGGHLGWIAIIRHLSHSGEAATLTASDWRAWLIIGLLGTSMLLTLVSMFVCLYFGLRRAPRVLPLCGLALSFFTGVFATFAVLIG